MGEIKKLTSVFSVQSLGSFVERGTLVSIKRGILLENLLINTDFRLSKIKQEVFLYLEQPLKRTLLCSTLWCLHILFASIKSSFADRFKSDSNHKQQKNPFNQNISAAVKYIFFLSDKILIVVF